MDFVPCRTSLMVSLRIKSSLRAASSAFGSGRAALLGFITWVKHIPAIVAHGGQTLKHRIAETHLGRSTPVRLIIRVVQEMGEDDATHMAASVSYYAVLSIFPLVIALSAIIGWMADSESRQDELVEFVVDFLPGSEQFVRDSVEGVERFRETLGVVAVLGLMWSASAVFGSITRVINRAWDIRQNPPFYKNKPRQLAMAMGVGMLFALSVGITSFMQWATTIEIGSRSASDIVGGEFFAIILRIPAALISFSIFLAIYKFLPNTKTYWKYVWTGAAVAAVLFELGKNLFLYYLSNFAEFDQLYGSVASVVVLMVWAYLCAIILIVGAELASEYGRMKMGVARGVPHILSR